ncbi:MAG: cytochrome c oxidase subunit 3 [Bacteroidetes bacterium]|nr:cytochrome c oxidase subunit 3 [Bacteroidota bacterium]
MSTVALQEKKPNLWQGGISPYGETTTWGKLMMWFFLLSDSFTFGAFLISYGTIRFANTQDWPNPNEVFSAFPGLGHADLPLVFVSLMTFILIMSSVTMVLGVRAGKENNQKGVLLWLGLTIIGGIMFLGCQAWEWTHMLTGEHPINLAGNPYGGPDGSFDAHSHGPVAFGQFFFTITGFHGFHVFTGIVINIIVWLFVLKGVYSKSGDYQIIENIGLYWHFVDLVWVFVFASFYLLSSL